MSFFADAIDRVKELFGGQVEDVSQNLESQVGETTEMVDGYQGEAEQTLSDPAEAASQAAQEQQDKLGNES